MSIDTSLANPTSTISWEEFLQSQKPVWAAERAAHCAEVRADLAASPVKERTAADALADIKRYKAMLAVPAVIASAPWMRDIEAKLAGARTELGRMRRQGGAL